VPGSYPPGSFDVVVMSHVVEHVEDPIEFVRTAAELLTPDGVLCLCQTNYRGTLPRWLGRRWQYWVAHEHYHHFSRQGIEALLARAGLVVSAVELPSLGYHWAPSFRDVDAVKRTLMSVVTVLTTRLRLGYPYEGDQLYVLAQRAQS
jgi:SAM-dependent methyltransferase